MYYASASSSEKDIPVPLLSAAAIGEQHPGFGYSGTSCNFMFLQSRREHCGNVTKKHNRTLVMSRVRLWIKTRFTQRGNLLWLGTA
jgi:hypothetical protein